MSEPPWGQGLPAAQLVHVPEWLRKRPTDTPWLPHPVLPADRDLRHLAVSQCCWVDIRVRWLPLLARCLVPYWVSPGPYSDPRVQLD